MGGIPVDSANSWQVAGSVAWAGMRTLRQLRSRILRNRDAGSRSLLFGAATTTGSCQIIFN